MVVKAWAGAGGKSALNPVAHPHLQVTGGGRVLQSRSLSRRGTYPEVGKISWVGLWPSQGTIGGLPAIVVRAGKRKVQLTVLADALSGCKSPFARMKRSLPALRH